MSTRSRVKVLAVAAVAVLGLAVVPTSAFADPPESSPPEQSQAGGRLDLYEFDAPPEVVAALIADGYDIVGTEPNEDDTLHVEAVMSRSEANKAHKAYDLDIDLTRNKDGVPTVDAAFEEADDGFDVFRKWSSPGGHKAEMEYLADQYDDLTELITIGQSVEGQDIYAMRVTEKADTKKAGSRPAVLYISTQHAREWIAPEVNSRLLKHVLSNYGSDPQITEIVDTRELWFVIVANPDGYDWTFEEGQRLWRKNLADNNGDGEITTIDGVDLNRNFATNWGYDNEGSSDNPSGQTYRGTAPQSEPETQAMDALMGSIDFAFMVNYHSAAELILYGTGWQVDSPSPDDIVNIALAGDDANPAIEGYDPDLSAELYITNGDTTDHAGDAHGIMAYTPELATCQTALSYPESTLPSDYCDGRSQFEFPDDETLVQVEFEHNLDYALSLAESAADPANPVSSLGLEAADFEVQEFEESWGDSQEVAVWAKREFKQLRMHSSVNGGPVATKAAGEWAGGEVYGDEGNLWYGEYRATVTGLSAGDSVEVWFSALDTPSGGGAANASKVESDHFTFDVSAEATGADVLIVSDNSPGTGLGGGAPLQYLDYYTDALDANGVSYDVYDVGVTGPAPSAMGILNHYDAVIWYEGDKLVTDYQGATDTTLLAHEMNMVMRAYLNEGGKVLATGKNHGFEEFFPLDYGTNGAPDQVCHGGDCLVLTDDVYQYWFGANSRARRGGLAADGSALDVSGNGGVFDGYTFGLDGGDSADNQGAPGAASTGTASFIVTSSVLPESEFPQFASERFASWDVGGLTPYEPVTGDWQMATDHADAAYKRLARTIDLTAASAATLEFSTSYGIEANWDYMFVEVHTVGQDDWTTLPDLNGHTGTGTGDSCDSGWATELHPFLFHYQDLACNPVGTTGEWNAATGASDGVETWSIDLSAYAGSEIEVSISYATDWATGDLGVFVDDVVVDIDGSPTTESFETDLGAWSVPGAPDGSAGNANDWERVGVLFEVAAIVATEDTLLFGFGFEGISTEAERNEVMSRSLDHLLG
ncbi:zinc carboxypeptidase [Agromyces rhizosphaerae]|uniref:Zinc carboxypeptidase n=1 Tax=Agromyces rhizosphaerae TaxID=88374 RepID=A0A9W6CVI7_9MICO|nr:zinc carboxypeptidase [Agromyces rhizosphaerae]